MFTIMDEKPDRFYSLRHKGVQVYTLIEKYSYFRPNHKDLHVSLFVVGKSRGVTGYKCSFNTRDSTTFNTKSGFNSKRTELGHSPYDLYDVCAYMNKALLSKGVKESLISEIIPDKELYDLLLTGDENLEPYEPDVYLYDDPDGYVYTMKERKQ